MHSHSSYANSVIVSPYRILRSDVSALSIFLGDNVYTLGMNVLAAHVPSADCSPIEDCYTFTRTSSDAGAVLQPRITSSFESGPGAQVFLSKHFWLLVSRRSQAILQQRKEGTQSGKFPETGPLIIPSFIFLLPSSLPPSTLRSALHPHSFSPELSHGLRRT